MRAISIVIVILFVTGLLGQSNAEEEPLREAQRLVLITAASFETEVATMQLFERDAGQKWVAVSDPGHAVIGVKGLAWWPTFAGYASADEPLKEDPDMRSPAGIFPLGPSFGYGDQGGPWKINLEAGKHYCVDDVDSPLYNRIVDVGHVGEGVNGEQMWTTVDYRRGLLIGYPTDIQRHPGSCIFLHVWTEPGQGTSGCIGMSLEDVEAIQRFAADVPTAIAILPAGAMDRFKGLPEAVTMAAKPRDKTGPDASPDG